MQPFAAPTGPGRSSERAPDSGNVECGMFSVWVSVTLVFLCLLAAAVGQVVSSGRLAADLLRSRVEEQVELEDIAEQVVVRLRDDLTPQADSPHDRVWQLIDTLAATGRRVELSDFSSDGGEGAYVNVNSAALEKVDLYLSNAGVLAPQRRSIIDELGHRRAGGLSTSGPQLEALLGPAYSLAFPLVCAEPTVNVNFASRETLYRVLGAAQAASPADRRASAVVDASVERAIGRIMADRAITEIAVPRLTRLLNDFPGRDSARLELGVRTWSWRIVATGKRRRLVRLLACVPAGNRRPLRTVGSYLEPVLSDLGRIADK